MHLLIGAVVMACGTVLAGRAVIRLYQIVRGRSTARPIALHAALWAVGLLLSPFILLLGLGQMIQG